MSFLRIVLGIFIFTTHYNIGVTDKPTYEPVKLTLFYEVLCPDCSLFIKKHLWPTYKAIGSIMDVELVPYGNAREKRNGDKYEFKCQHGEEECLGNMFETCAIHRLGTEKAFPFVVCMETCHDGRSMAKCAEKCAEEEEVDLDPILVCTYGKEGNNLMHLMAQKTQQSDPWISFVPWITVNDEHSKEISGKCWYKLKEYICELYKGPLPLACQRSDL